MCYTKLEGDLMKIDRVVVGSLQTNCYILSIGNNCLVIDPGDEYHKIKQVINNKNVVGVVITHNHFDHVGALNYFDNIYDYHNLKEGINNIEGFNFEVIYTPGHTDDSIVIYFKEDKVMFVGDFIFKDGVGRTDLGGNYYDLVRSIKKMFKYDKNITLYPGHGDSTKLGIEMKYLDRFL